MIKAEEKILVGLLSYNNGELLKETLLNFGDKYPFDVVVHIDGSTDSSDKCLSEFNYPELRNIKNSGIGKSLKNVIKYALNSGYTILAVIPANGKNNPLELIKIVQPLINENYDYIQASRFLDGGRTDNTPIFRLLMVKIHAKMMSFLTGRKCTDALEGVRAYKLSIFDGNDINIWQDWLDTYEFETYVSYKVLKNKKFKVKELPISKIYPKNKKHIFNLSGKKYSHIRPIIDWWHILKPILYLILKIKK